MPPRPPSAPGRLPGQWLLAISVGLALGLLAVLFLLLQFTREADQARAAQELASHAGEVRADLALHLSGDTRLLAALARRVVDEPLDQAGFIAEARALMASHPGIVRISWYGPDRQRVWSVAPRHGGGPLNETVATVRRATSSGEAFSPPFHLPEGPGFVVVEGALGPDGPRGFVSAGYVAGELLEHAHPETGEGDHDVALVGPGGELLAGRRDDLGLQQLAALDPPGHGVRVLVSRRPAPVRALLLGLAAAAGLLGLGLALNLRALRRQLLARFRAETAARDSEARFREVADTAPVLIWMSGTDAKCHFFNRPWLEFRGRSLEQEQGDGWAEGVHPEDVERCVATYLEAFGARQPFKMEYRLRRHDGEHRWVLDHGIPRHDAAGQFLGYIGSCIDITERRQLEADLDRTRFALERLAEPVLWVAPDGRFLEANEAACRHFGLGHEEILRRSVPDLDPLFSPERWAAHWRELVERGSLTLETRHRRADGSEVEVELTVNHLVHGGQAYGCAFVRDISVRKSEERRLLESERRLRAIVDHLPAGAVLVEDGRFHLNRAAEEITGYGADELPTLDSWFRLIHGAQAAEMRASYEADRQAGFPATRVVELRRKDGQLRRVEVAAHAAPEGDVVLLHDVTDREQALAAQRAVALQQQAMLATTGDGFWATDLQGRLVDVNERYCYMSGYSRDELLALAIADLEASESPVEAARHVRSVISQGWDRFETRHRRKDGREFCVEVSVTFVEPLGRLICFLRDVTERQRAEQALRESEARHRSVVEALSEGVVLQAADGTVVACNAAADRLLGLAPGRLLGRTGLEPGCDPLRQDGRPLSREEDAFSVALREARPVRGRVLGYRAPGGRTAWLSVNSVPLFSGGAERPTGVVSTFVDVTRERRAEAHRLAEARRLRFSLELSEAARDLSEEQVLERVVEEAVALTGSQVGYLHRVNDDQRTLRLSTWSHAALQACTAAFASHYPIDEAGIWADSARRRAPVVHNDYQAETARRGYPQGHFPVLRHASVPALDGEQVRLVLGVGNKPEPYDDDDLAQLQALAADAGRVVMRQRAELGLRESEERYRVFLDNFQGVAYQAELDGGAPDFVRGRVLDLTGHEAEEFTGGSLTWDAVVVPEDRPRRQAALMALRAGELAVCCVDYRIRRRDGLVRWVEELGLLVRRGAERQVVQAAIYDVSVHKQAELRELHRREVLELLARGAPLSEVLEGIARSIEAERPSSLCSILLLDAEGRRLLHGAAPSLPEYYNRAVDGLEIGEGVGSCGAAAATGRRVVAEDLEVHPNWQAYRELTRRAGLRACWSEPVVSAAGEVLGTFAIYRRRPRIPDDDEIRAVEGAARFAAIAIERSRADLALRESEASLARLVERLAEANRVLAGVAGSQSRFISGDGPAGVFQEVVAALVDLTASARGILCEVRRRPDGSRALESLAECGPGWEAGPVETGGGGALQELMEGASEHEGPLLAEDVGSDPRLAGRLTVVPRPPSFLSLPVRRGSELLGLLGLAGRWGGYSEEMLPDVDPLVTTAATLIEAARATRLHAAAEAERKEMLERALASERRLSESEQRYRGLVERVDAIVWEAEPANMQLVFVNERAAGILGYPEGELCRPGFWGKHVHPDDRGPVVRQYAQLRPGLPLHTDYRMLAADGRVVWLHEVARLETDEQGRPLRVAGVSLDVTRSRELEHAVRVAASEWVATFDAVEFAILVLDSQSHVVRVNRAAAALAGADWGACLGRLVERLGDGEPWRTAALLARDTCPESPIGARQVRDAAGRSWDVDATLAVGREEAPDRVIVAIHDVTNLVELTESVKRSETMVAMGSLVAGVAHEVRNPLFAMSVNIDALALELQGLPEIRELVDALRAERDRISRIMEELLHYGRPTPARRGPGALEPVLVRALQACAAHAARSRVQLERAGSTDGCRLQLDPDRLEEVFQNLLDNACQHSPAGSRVVLETHTSGAGWVEVQVRDFGSGFPSDILPRAFEPFVTRRKGGIGLGLAIVQRIVDEHGGRVRAANPPGGGAVVTVELPLLPVA